MSPMIDAAILVVLGINAGLVALLLARSKWHRLWGKFALIACCLILAAALVAGSWRVKVYRRLPDIKKFTRESIERLNAGQLPEMSPKCTDGVLRDIETLRGADLPTDYTVETSGYSGTYDYYVLDMRTKDNEPFWSMVEPATAWWKLFVADEYRLLELSPPASVLKRVKDAPEKK
ncbi:MAG: hypothetical protein QG656_577 [Candidatus Hydrogenedentes bacterium]|nr:hypothetical protein [Candidatus Hydrogenedentota bacterium]